jgi:hypothetical protein
VRLVFEEGAPQSAPLFLLLAAGFLATTDSCRILQELVAADPSACAFWAYLAPSISAWHYTFHMRFRGLATPFGAALIAGSILFSPISISQSAAKKPDVQFSGEVTRGQSFERPIGHGLVFRLARSAGRVDVGWEIEIAPDPASNPQATGRTGGYEEFSTIATPPYHSYNERYLETSYGMKAPDAVAITPRDFQFVESVADSDAADALAQSVLSSSDFPDHSQALAAAAEKIHVGAGELRIVASRTTAGKDGSETGTIDWLRFEVSLSYDSGQTMKDILFPPEPASSAR